MTLGSVCINQFLSITVKLLDNIMVVVRLIVRLVRFTFSTHTLAFTLYLSCCYHQSMFRSTATFVIVIVYLV